MKTTKIIFTIALFISSTFLNAQIKVTSNGNVGIGTSNPSTVGNVTVEGDNIVLRSKTNKDVSLVVSYSAIDGWIDFGPYDIADGATYTIGNNYPLDYISATHGWVSYLNCFTLTQCSDKRLKKNITTIPYNREAFQKLNPVSFDISDSLLLNVNSKKAGKKSTCITEYGFIAQEVQEMYPQLVSQDKKTGFLTLKPLEIIPILVSALHDQQAQIEALTALVSKSNSGPKKVGASTTSNTSETDALTYPVLDQNVPNPFNTSTTIGYYLPTSISNASIYVYDMNGVQLKSYSINQREKGNITIQGSELNAGMYLYALIADGKVIDTKRMILTK